ncbi:MAG: glutamate racemase [Succinivibrio sp.]|nr:glutamate racemase [Succinivibrio sp.]
MENKRVLFFDSGVGGLSIYEEVKKAVPQLEGLYLFDHECFPYGSKSESFLLRRIGELLTGACRRFEPQAVVVACNTASTVVLPTLRQHMTLPVVGVVPAIKPAAALSQKKIIALLATPGTVEREYTKALIADFASDCRVLCLGSADLANIAELRVSRGSVDEQAIAEILKPICALPESEKPDVVVLGCTHYPFIRDILQKLLPGMTIIDSGEAIGRRVREVLRQNGVDFAGEEPPGAARAFYTGHLEHYEDRLSMVRRFGFVSLEQFEL